jgi:hypothetical protein
MRLVRGACLLAIAAAIVAAGASPAAAHGVGGREPTNVRSRVVEVLPSVAELDVQVIENGERVELTNAGDTEVTVFGYEDEPYLRVGPEGVFENARSPAVYVNRTLDPPAMVPGTYDADADPEWRRISTDDTTRWHDHRAHRMGAGSFPTSQWTIELTAGEQPVVVRGELAWVEPGPWWPWLLLAAGIAVAVALAARAAWRLTVTLMLALLCFAEVVHMAGSWSEVATTLPGRFAAQIFSIVAVALGAYALSRVSRDEPGASAPFVLIAAVVFIVAGGIGDVSAWFRSQLPSTLPAGTVRALVALAFGGGVGLGVAAATHLATASASASARDHDTTELA